MVLAFAAVLIMAGIIRGLLVAPRNERTENRKRALRATGILFFAACVLSGLWVVVAPAGDHPLLSTIEAISGFHPEQFLSPRERMDFTDAAETERRHKSEVDRLYELERRSRWQGEPLSPDEVRRLASMQQTLTEMGRGERFVLEHLRARARSVERWYIGVPLAALGLLGIAAVMWSARRGSMSPVKDVAATPAATIF